MKQNDFETREELYKHILKRVWRCHQNKHLCTVPTISCYSGYSDKYSHAITVAALWALAGVERVKITERFEHFSISSMLMSNTSLVTSPYVGVQRNPTSRMDTAVWWVGGILQLHSGGGSSKDHDYAQISWLPRKEMPVDTVDVHTVFDAVRTKILRDYPGHSSAQDMYDYYHSLKETNSTRG